MVVFFGLNSKYQLHNAKVMMVGEIIILKNGMLVEILMMVKW